MKPSRCRMAIQSLQQPQAGRLPDLHRRQRRGPGRPCGAAAQRQGAGDRNGGGTGFESSCHHSLTCSVAFMPASQWPATRQPARNSPALVEGPGDALRLARRHMRHVRLVVFHAGVLLHHLRMFVQRLAGVPMTNSCISLPALCTTKVTVSPRLQRQLRRVEAHRIAHRHAHRARGLLRVALAAPGVVVGGDRAAALRTAVRLAMGPSSRRQRQADQKQVQLDLQCLCPPRGFDGAPRRAGVVVDFAAVGVGGRRALRVQRLARPFVGHAALRVRYQPGSR